MNAMFGWVNRAVGNPIQVSSEQPTLPGANVQNPQGSAASGWQTTTASYAAIRIDAGSAVAWRAFGAFRTNLTAAAQVRVRITADSGTSTVLWDSGTVGAGVTATFGQSVLTAPADASGRYCFIEWMDPTNPDNFINIPLLFAGPVWQPMTNIGPDSAFGRDDTTDETVARGGAEFPVTQFVRRRWDVSLGGIRASEMWTQAMDLDAYSRTGGNVLFIADPAGDVSRETVFGRAKALSDVTFPYGTAERRAWKTRITERL